MITYVQFFSGSGGHATQKFEKANTGWAKIPDLFERW